MNEQDQYGEKLHYDLKLSHATNVMLFLYAGRYYSHIPKNLLKKILFFLKKNDPKKNNVNALRCAAVLLHYVIGKRA